MSPRRQYLSQLSAKLSPQHHVPTVRDDYAHLEEATSASAWAMLKRLPVLVATALGYALRASKASTIAAIGLNTLAAAATTFGLLATQDVAQAAPGSGPSWEKVSAAGYAQARLKPVVANVVESEYFGITTAVPLSAYDDEALSSTPTASSSSTTAARSRPAPTRNSCAPAAITPHCLVYRRAAI